jgi:hypothetical protein
MLRGDGPTSDRLQNAFVVGTVPVIIAPQDWLPFGFAIPWDRILYRVSGDAFARHPIASIDWASDGDDLRERQRLIQEHKADLLFSHPNSRVVHNIIRGSQVRLHLSFSGSTKDPCLAGGGCATTGASTRSAARTTICGAEGCEPFDHFKS